LTYLKHCTAFTFGFLLLLLREAIKMVLLLPTVPLRLMICVMSIILVALVNSIAIFGW